MNRDLDNIDVKNIRRDYQFGKLVEKDLESSPFDQFKKWFDEALKNSFHDPTAMSLSTVAANGRPSSRIVLLKGYDEHGFRFFTNYKSRKGEEISQTGFGSILFWWDKMERQVRIEGRIEKVSKEESEVYFSHRPRNSQIGAWTSKQSSVIDNAEVLTERFQQLEKEFSEKEIPLPDFWGGYRLIPDYFEFWQGRESRLHDRLVFRLTENSKWQIERISP